MNIFVVLIVVAIVIALLVALKAKQAKLGAGPGYISKDALFTLAERSFLGVLDQALDSNYRVFGKVRLGDIVKPAKGLSASKRATAQNRINQKHVDFVICAAADLALIGVLELDDQSHGREDRAERDRLVDQALDMAGIPIVRFSAKRGYELPEVRAKLAAILPAAKYPDFMVRTQETVDPVPTAPVCQKCGEVMVMRQAIKGAQAGKWFWTCSEFPRCRHVVAAGEI